MMELRRTRFILVLVALHISVTIAGRGVRNIRSHAEYKKFLKHHKLNTGLPVAVDFYSDGCGPCRMIAPIYARLAKEFKGRVAFAKVNVNYNHETSSILGIRSMPTFYFYVLGKKKYQFSGGDPGQLRQRTMQISREAKRYNIEITPEALKKFYAKYDDKKTDEDIKKILAKYPKGYGHFKLREKLAKKYKAAPKRTRYVYKKPKKQAPKGKPDQPNLQLATLEELKAEIAKRRENIEEEEPEEEVFVPPAYSPSSFPEKVVIIGAGPAGLAAAVYASRAGLSPVIVAPPVGGQLMGKGVNVENYPGIISNTGPGIVDLMLRQAAEFGTTFVPELVTEVDFKSRPFSVKTANVSLTSHTVILATGSVSRWLGVEGEHDLRGGGVSSCATCDGFLFANKPVVVIGGGDTAMEDALVLARTSSSVTVIHRKDTFRASKILQDRVLKHPKITVLWNSVVTSFKGAEEKDPDTGDIMKVLTHAAIRATSADGKAKARDIEAAGAFVAIGHDPSTDIYRDQVALEDNNYVHVQHGSTKTSVPGVFAAGDVADHVYRQAVTSAGSGAMAALDAERYLSEKGVTDEKREACVDDVMDEILSDIKSKEASKPQ